MKITIFGGSFDPPHLGHLAIAKKSLETSNHLVFIPAKQSPHKKNKPAASEIQRMKMLILMTEKLENTQICNFEIDQNYSSYTWITVQKIKSEFQGSAIEVVIGSDLLPELNNWYNADKLFNEVSFICFQRGGIISEIPDNCKMTFFDKFDYNVSSTKIRQLFSEGKIEKVKEYLHPPVYRYIMNEGIYK